MIGLVLKGYLRPSGSITIRGKGIFLSDQGPFIRGNADMVVGASLTPDIAGTTGIGTVRTTIRIDAIASLAIVECDLGAAIGRNAHVIARKSFTPDIAGNAGVWTIRA
ncbi:hypothetical protein KDH_48170 [Dictyobacter sp. S3.2.2.5]|uniref:Uncharacterized protein n=1 Tax=Dictyobacter halimunensis TaxID=3026934 RepID=A0ABQ6FUQ3_9CHLR|nr:hypothetical protein KDH_48170 [Dictyobacter sp. S3.2.2.5]